MPCCKQALCQLIHHNECSYLFSLPRQHIQIKENIINTTKTPPNVNKNIPNDVSCGDGGSPGWTACVPTLLLVGLTEASVVTVADVYLVAAILVRFGEITLLGLFCVAEVLLKDLKHNEVHEGLGVKLVFLENVAEELELRRPVINVII